MYSRGPKWSRKERRGCSSFFAPIPDAALPLWPSGPSLHLSSKHQTGNGGDVDGLSLFSGEDVGQSERGGIPKRRNIQPTLHLT